MGYGELHCGTSVEDDGTFRLQAEDLGCQEWFGCREVGDGGGAVAVEFDVAAEVLGTRREAVSEEMDELVLRAGKESIVAATLLADGGGALGSHLATAE